jgi:two-component system phosphate regulon response regulator PhoB
MPRVAAKVLIAEDEPELRSLIRMALEFAPFELLETADADATLEVARRERPDLILLDRRMPGADGLDVCRALRADPRTAPARIVLLTVRAQNVDRLEGFRAGADDYVTKPFSPNQLAEKVHAVLQRAEEPA